MNDFFFLSHTNASLEVMIDFGGVHKGYRKAKSGGEEWFRVWSQGRKSLEVKNDYKSMIHSTTLHGGSKDGEEWLFLRDPYFTNEVKMVKNGF